MRSLTAIIVHCSATRPEWMAGEPPERKIAEIERWHQARKFRTIGYHYLIDRDGTVAEGRPLDQAGAHVRGRNRTTIGICLLGGHGSSENDAFNDNFTPAQDKSLRALIARLKRAHPTIKTVSGHNEYAAKACPGFRVNRWLAHAPPARSTPAQSTTLWAAGSSASAALAGAGSVLGQLSPAAQIVMILATLIVLAGAVWIARERLRAWARGQR